MKLYEFEGKILFQKAGIPVPRGTVVATVDEAGKRPPRSATLL